MGERLLDSGLARNPRSADCAAELSELTGFKLVAFDDLSEDH